MLSGLGCIRPGRNEGIGTSAGVYDAGLQKVQPMRIDQLPLATVQHADAHARQIGPSPLRRSGTYGDGMVRPQSAKSCAGFTHVEGVA